MYVLDVAETNEKRGYRRKTLIYVPRVQNIRKKGCSINDGTLDELRDCNDASIFATRISLDYAGCCYVMSTFPIILYNHIFLLLIETINFSIYIILGILFILCGYSTHVFFLNKYFEMDFIQYVKNIQGGTHFKFFRSTVRY